MQSKHCRRKRERCRRRHRRRLCTLQTLHAVTQHAATLHAERCTPCVHCTLCVHCMLCAARCALHAVHCMLCATCCALHAVNCMLYTACMFATMGVNTCWQSNVALGTKGSAFCGALLQVARRRPLELIESKPGAPGGNLCDIVAADDFHWKVQTLYGRTAPEERCWLVQVPVPVGPTQPCIEPGLL